MVVSGVFNLAYGTIRLDQGVVSMYDITIAGLMLRLVVTSVGVRHGVREVIFGVDLAIIKIVNYNLVFSTLH